VDAATGRHTLLASKIGYTDIYQMADLTAGGKVDLPVLMQESLASAVNVLAAQGTSVPITSNVIREGQAMLAIPPSNRFNVDGQPRDNVDITLEYYDLSNPLPVPMPSPQTLAAQDQLIGGKQAPSVLVSLRPAMLTLSSPATLTLPNPDGLTVNRILRFDPELHQWKVVANRTQTSVLVTQGGVYGIFYEEARSGSIRGNANPGSIIGVGDVIVTVGADGGFYINEVPIPYNELVKLLALGAADAETGKRTPTQSSISLDPGGQAFVDLAPSQVEITGIQVVSNAEKLVADGKSQVSITASVSGDSGPVPDGTSVSFTTSAGTLSAANGKTLGGKAIVSLTSSQVSGVTAIITARAGGVSSSTSVEFVPVPKSIAITSTQFSVKSDNSDSAIITATVLRNDNAPFSGVTVAFTADGGQLSSAQELEPGEQFSPASVTTGPDGTAQVKFSSGVVDKTNRVVMITATVGGLPTKSYPIQIMGTTIELESDRSNVDVEGEATAKVSINLKDAGLNPIFDEEITVSVDPPGSLTWTPSGTLKTDVNGNLKLTVYGARVEEEAILKAEALGATAVHSYVVSSINETFSIIEPVDDIVSVETGKELTIKVRAPQQQRVRLSASFGQWKGDTDGDHVVDVPVQNGEVSAVISSTDSGVATIQAADVEKPTTSDSLQVAFVAPSGKAQKIAIQSSSSVVAPSVGNVSNSVTIKATVKTVENQIVSGAAVVFSLSRTTGGGEYISPAISYTNSSGIASATFTSGALGSDAKGVLVTATVVGSSPKISDSISIVIGGTAGSVLIGTANTVRSVHEDTAYELPMSVLVTDTNGNPVPGAQVSLSSWPSKYGTGFRDGEEPCPPIYTGIFDNEDVNRNLIKDPGEDKNTDGELTPPSTASGSLPASVITGDNGVAELTLTYLKESSSWIESEIVASTLVAGTETRSTLKFWLPYAADDGCELGISPYNRFEVGSISLTATPQNLAADGVSKSSILASVKDSGGNPIAVGSVDFTLGENNPVGHISAQTVLAINGQASVEYTAPKGVPANNKVTIIASGYNAEGEKVSAEITITLIEFIVSQLDISAGANSIMVQGLGGLDETLIQAQARISAAQLVPDGTPITFTTTAGTFKNNGAARIDAESVNGIATVRLLSSEIAGTTTVTASAGGVLDSLEIDFTPGPPSHISITADPGTLIAGDDKTSSVKATVYDGNDNPVENGVQVTFSAGKGTLLPLVSQTSDGVAATVYTAPKSTPEGGLDSVTAKVAGGIEGKTDIAIIGPSIADIALEISPPNIPIKGAKATVRATVTLVGGGSVPDGTEVLFTIKEQGDVGTIDSPATTVSAVATTFLTSGNQPRTVTVRAEAGGLFREAQIQYTPGSVTLEISAITILGTGQEEEVRIEAILKDADGVPIELPAGDELQFTLSDTSLGDLLTTIPGETAHQRIRWFRGGTKGGTATITGTWLIKSGGTVVATVIGTANIIILAPPASIEPAKDSDGTGNLLYPNPHFINIRGTGGQSTSQIAFDVKDGFGNPVSDGYKIVFKITSGPNGKEELAVPFAVTSRVRDPDGNEKAGRVITVLRSGSKPGPVNIKATYFYDSNVSANSQVSIVAGPPVGHAFSIFSEFVNVSGLSTSGIQDKVTITASDNWGNAVADNTAIAFKTYNTGGIFSRCSGTDDISEPGVGFTNGGFASNCLFTTPNPPPVQGFVFATAEAIGGPSTHVTGLTVVPQTVNKQIVYAGTDGGGIYKSTDSGVTWENISRSTFNSRFAQNRIDPYVKGRTAIAVDPDDQNVVFAGTGYLGAGRLYRSVDGGMNWHSDDAEEWNAIFQTDTAVLTVLADGGNSEYIWLGTEGNGVFYTKDPDTEFPADLCIDEFSGLPDLSRVGCVDELAIRLDMYPECKASSQCLSNAVIHFPFVQASGLGTGKTVWDITQIKNTSVMYAASVAGVFRSNDDGKKWSEVARPGFIGDSIKVLKVHPKSTGGSNDILYVGTEDSGAWVSTDSGNSWTNYLSGLGGGLSATPPVPDTQNRGSGIMKAVTVYTAAQSENWTVTCITEQPDGGVFSVVGSISGPQPNYDISTGQYLIPNVLSFRIEDGILDFKTTDGVNPADKFTFVTTRDNGRHIKDLLVDPLHNLLYAITYFEGTYEAHPVGNVYVHELEPNGAMSPTDWREANTGLPEFDPPDDTTLHPQYVLAADNADSPRALFVGGGGINLHKASTGLDTGTVAWVESKTGMTNLIMARMPILFSDNMWMTITPSKSVAEVLKEIDENPSRDVVVTYKIYIEDRNGNPPVRGAKLTIIRGITVIGELTITDEYLHVGTWPDKNNPLTNWPYFINVSVYSGDLIRFLLTNNSECLTPGLSPGCAGSSQTMTFSY
jgi:hypothetical protein